MYTHSGCSKSPQFYFFFFFSLFICLIGRFFLNIYFLFFFCLPQIELKNFTFFFFYLVEIKHGNIFCWDTEKRDSLFSFIYLFIIFFFFLALAVAILYDKLKGLFAFLFSFTCMDIEKMDTGVQTRYTKK